MKILHRLYQIENRKLRHRKNLLLLVAMLGIELVWVWYSFCDNLKNWTGMEYLGMVYLVPQLIVIFFPLTLGILASRLCDMEHKGNNFKILCTVEERGQIYEIKVLMGLKYIILLTASQLLMILAMGQLYQYQQAIPWKNIFFLIIEVFIVSICVFLVQLILSLFIENQLIPLVVGLVGSFSGLFTLYVPQIRAFTIWGYYVLLAPVGFWWDEESRDYGVVDAPCKWLTLFIFILLAGLLYGIGKMIWNRKEV